MINSCRIAIVTRTGLMVFSLFLFLCIWVDYTEAIILFKETFDTVVTKNKELYDARFANHQIMNGNLVLFYSSLIKSPPSGMECTLPLSPIEPDERQIDLRFTGGGMEWSNTLDVVYAVGPGDGLCLAPLHQRFRLWRS